MATRLEQIVAAARHRISQTCEVADLREWERMAAEHTPRGFRLSIQRKSGVAIIAELKKASPSRGVIRENFDVRNLAAELEAAGAAALSVLTDEEFFQGSLQNLALASATTHLPCLRKDFIVDQRQILEARASRADAVLLIVAALSQQELIDFSRCASSTGLDVLCEVHDQEEMKRALDAGCNIIGVNSRDLRSFEVDLNTAFSLAEKIPAAAVRVAESGIHSGQDIARLSNVGYDAVLVGESLMKAPSPGEALRLLVKEAAPEKASIA